MKVSVFFSAIVLGALLVSPGNSLSSDDSNGETFVLDGGSRGTVTFPHGRHQGLYLDCKPCHDLFEEESKVIENMKTEGKLKKREAMNMCKKCHKDMTAKGEKTGPVTCKGCHKK